MNEKIVFPESGLQVGMRVRERDVRADGRPQRRGTVVGHDSEEPFVVYVWWDGNRAPVDLPEKIWTDCLFAIESVPTSIPEHDSPRVSTATGAAPGIAVGTRVREREVRVGRPPKVGTVRISYGDLNDIWVYWDGDDGPLPAPLESLEVIARGIAVGARVRYQGVQDVGTVTSTDGKRAMVRWDHGITSDRWITNLVLVDAPPDRAPERVLSPNIVQSPDGMPVILGTGITTFSIYREWKLCHYPNGDNKTMEAIADDYGACAWEVHEAIAFEAGVRWAKERRKAKKAKGKDRG